MNICYRVAFSSAMCYRLPVADLRPTSGSRSTDEPGTMARSHTEPTNPRLLLYKVHCRGCQLGAQCLATGICTILDLAVTIVAEALAL